MNKLSKEDFLEKQNILTKAQKDISIYIKIAAERADSYLWSKCTEKYKKSLTLEEDIKNLYSRNYDTSYYKCDAILLGENIKWEFSDGGDYGSDREELIMSIDIILLSDEEFFLKMIANKEFLIEKKNREKLKAEKEYLDKTLESDKNLIKSLRAKYGDNLMDIIGGKNE